MVVLYHSEMILNFIFSNYKNSISICSLLAIYQSKLTNHKWVDPQTYNHIRKGLRVTCYCNNTPVIQMLLFLTPKNLISGFVMCYFYICAGQLSMLAAAEGSAGWLFEFLRASKVRNQYSHFNTERVCGAGDDGRTKRDQRDERRKRSDVIESSSLGLFSPAVQEIRWISPLCFHSSLVERAEINSYFSSGQK